MEKEEFPYDLWVNDALCGVLRRALETLAKTGNVGKHHFFINFDTTHEETEIPDFLFAQYPEEITIVLQHQFENLVVKDTHFSVSLSFGGKMSRLTVPFDSVISFADPSVNFGLQMGVNSTTSALMQLKSEDETISKGFNNSQNHSDYNLYRYDTAHESAEEIDSGDIKIIDSETSNQNKSKTISETAEVIALDTFRKK